MPKISSYTFALCNLCLLIASFFLWQDLKKIAITVPELHFLHVGTADAILLKLPTQHHILIDTGENGELFRQLPRYTSFFDRKIDLLVVSSVKPPYSANVPETLQRYYVRRIIHDIEEDISLGDGYKLDFLLLASQHPLVFRLLHYSQPLAFFASDIQEKEEFQLLARGYDFASPLLKVGHFGASTTLFTTFLKNMSPKQAIISVEKNNSQGYPHKNTLAKLHNVRSYLSYQNNGVSLSYADGHWAPFSLFQ